jgi:drug/metabolite transporter (DMT)-like permease
MLIGSFLWASLRRAGGAVDGALLAAQGDGVDDLDRRAPLICAGAAGRGRHDWQQVNVWGWSGLLYSAVFAIVMATSSGTTASRSIGGARTALYNNLIPVVGAISAAPSS